MAKIKIKTVTPFPNALYEVEIVSETTTIHRVRLNENYYQKLTGGKLEAVDLVRITFEFLLEREANTAILPEFELPLVNRYFPEYEKEISELISLRS